jgi:hypothetical protein
MLMSMGWAIGFDPQWNRDIGYGVPAECDHPDCKEQIDRGLWYVCGGEPYGGEHGCGLFFCGEHLFMSLHEEDPAAFLCERCADWHSLDEDEQDARSFVSFDPKPDVEEWAYHKATDPSWATWRAEEGIPA